jgi:hypothetical protein
MDDEETGIITKFLLNANEDISGFLLDGEHQVHIYPQDDKKIFDSIKLGEKITVQGVRSQSVDLIFASKIINSQGFIFKVKNFRKIGVKYSVKVTCNFCGHNEIDFHN